MSELNIQPMQWNNILDINEVTPVTDGDQQLLTEIRNVLKKHGALERFGLNIIHRHFEVADDEVLLECTDVENRTLITKPVKKSEVELENTTVTQWRLTEGESVAEVGCTCYRSSHGHEGRHART